MATVLLILLLTIPSLPESVTAEQVDVVEVNHFYDDNGRHVFDQVIFYDWSDGWQRHQVVAWRLIKDRSQLPQRNWQASSESYVTFWVDQEVLRKVTAKSFRETWTQYDPELLEREALRKEDRRELRISRRKT